MPYGLYGLAPNGGSLVISGTANRVAIFNSSGELAASPTVSDTELSYLDGVTSAIQTQINDITTLANGKIYIGNASNQITEVTISGDITIDNTGVAAISAGVIVNADVNATAGIDKSKLAAGTASRVEVTDASGFLVESAVTSTQLTYLSNVQELQSVSLNDNQASAAVVLSFAHASYNFAVIEYSLARGAGNREVGQLMIATDGSTVSLTQESSTIGTLGVTFTAVINGANVELKYTSTSTGTAPTFKSIQRKWV